MTTKIFNVFDNISDFENLRRAFYSAAKGKMDRCAVLNIYKNLEENIMDISNALKNETYQFGPYRSFYVRKPKVRLIESACFRDRIVHHSIHKSLEPIYEAVFYYHSYACRTGRGTHSALGTLSKWSRTSSSKYFLKCDVKKFFPSIERATLFDILKKTIDDKKLVNCLERLIFNAPNTGIPIGNLTSQLFANVYLNELDQYVKRSLRVKYYIRYMDDFILFAKSPVEARELKGKIENFLIDRLRLTLSPQKVQVGHIKDGISFLGYIVFPAHVRLRGKALRRMRKKLFLSRLKDLQNEVSESESKYFKTLMSYKGQIQFITSRNEVWRQLTKVDLGLF